MTLMSGKTVVITGGNAGIGRASALALSRLGAHIVLACRNLQKGAEAQQAIQSSAGGTVDLVELDLADLDSVRAATRTLIERYPNIDVLLNNAGLMLGDRTVTKQGYETVFATNHLGPFLLTHGLLGHLTGGGPVRIVNVASAAHNFARSGIPFDDLQHERAKFAPLRVYGISKLANILFTQELARRLAGTQATTNSLHPGFVRSGFARDDEVSRGFAVAMKIARPFGISIEKGARTSVYLASSPEVATSSGQYFVNCKPKTPTAHARDSVQAQRLWEVSEALCGIS
jgi:retinol dehydrogenase-12